MPVKIEILMRLAVLDNSIVPRPTMNLSSDSLEVLELRLLMNTLLIVKTLKVVWSMIALITTSAGVLVIGQASGRICSICVHVR